MADSNPSRPTYPRGTLFFTVFLDLAGFGMILPLLPFYAQRYGADALQVGLLFSVYSLAQAVGAPALGRLSDRFGRRPVILLSNFGLGLDYVLMALAPSIAWLFVGRVLSGITAASFSTASAYIADVTPPEKRAGAFGMLGAAFGIGFVLGPALGGVLGAADPRLPFWVAGVLSFLNALYGLFVLPESLAPEHRETFRWTRANPLGSLRLLRRQPELLGLAVVLFLGGLAHEVLPSTFVLYAGYRYDWDARTLGLTLAAVGVCSGIVQGALVRPIVARFGERRALLTGLVFGSLGFAAYGLAPTGAWFWAGIPLMSIWGLAGPSAQGLMTRLVSPSEQGKLQGAHGSLRGIAGLFGPGLFTLTFAAFISTLRDWHLPGAPFLVAALLVGSAVPLALKATRRPAGAEGLE